MLGFAPGFPYLGGMDERIACPRLATPRTLVPAGAVGIAESQTGVYPNPSPGGWQLIGRTPMKLFDVDADPPSAMLPGTKVNFVPISPRAIRRNRQFRLIKLPNSQSHIEIVSPGNLLTVQDLGRRGSQRFGVSVSGVLDLQAAIMANRLVGNPTASAMLEATFGGVSLTFDSETKVAVTGATADLYLDEFPMPIWETVIVPSGATLSVSIPAAGLYSYIAVAGGIEVARVLGSRSTHLGSGLGGYQGRALSQSDVLKIGEESTNLDRPRAGTSVPVEMARACDDNERRVRVLSGPSIRHFQRRIQIDILVLDFHYQQPDKPPRRSIGGNTRTAIDGKHDIVSDPAYMGAVQIPSDGKPIVLPG